MALDWNDFFSTQFETQLYFLRAENYWKLASFLGADKAEFDILYALYEVMTEKDLLKIWIWSFLRLN